MYITFGIDSAATESYLFLKQRNYEKQTYLYS